MTHTLEIGGIQLEFDSKKNLSNIYLKCETGKITGLLGRNGQGKSSLMKIAYGTLAAEKSIRFDNISIVTPYKAPNLLLFLTQQNFIPKSLTIKRVLKDFQLDCAEFKKRFIEFSRIGNTSIRNLSGGERRLLEIYVIVKSPAKFALLDEPFTHLNPIQIEQVKALLIEEKQNKGILITDHMFKHVIEVSDSIYILTNGQTYLTNTPSDIEKYGYGKL
jgi:ABC-type multidrug transport system ATPase subunit